MQLELSNDELELIGNALEKYAGHVVEHSHKDDDLVPVECLGRKLCTKVLAGIDLAKQPMAIETLFVNARNAFCGIADDGALAEATGAKTPAGGARKSGKR